MGKVLQGENGFLLGMGQSREDDEPVLACVAPGGKTKKTGVDLKMERGKGHVGIELRFGGQIQGLHDAHGVDLHGDAFPGLEAAVFQPGEGAVDHADFFSVLVDVHPGFRRAGNLNCLRPGRRGRFFPEELQAMSQQAEKYHRDADAPDPMPLDFCHARQTFPAVTAGKIRRQYIDRNRPGQLSVLDRYWTILLTAPSILRIVSP